MAPRKTSPKPVESDPDDLPEWKRQSVDRSLQGARARAQERSDRFVKATIELMEERGSLEFTVQDVADRSHMSIRTFYNFFASKDDLLVAVHETVLATYLAPSIRARCEAEPDPVERVHVYIKGMYAMTKDAGPVSRALTTYRNRLTESRPEDLDRAFRPQVELVHDLIAGADEAGCLTGAVDVETASKLLHHTVLAAVHGRVLGLENEAAISVDDLWKFCARGIGLKASGLD